MTEVDPIDVLIKIGNLRKFVAESAAAADAVRSIGGAVADPKVVSGNKKGMSVIGGGLALAKKLAIGTAGAVAVIGVEAAKAGIKFRSEMLKLHTQAGASLPEVKMFSKYIENVKGLQQTPLELAKGLYAFSSVGLKGEAALKGLIAASHGAAVGGAHLEETTHALAAAMVAFEVKSQNSGKTMGTLNAIVGVGKLRMEELVGSFRQGILPVAELGGTGLRSLGAALAVMTDRGVTASRGMQYLRQAIFYLASESTGPAKKALAALGLTGQQVADELKKPDGIYNVVKLLHERMANLPKSKVLEYLKALGGGARSSSGLAAVYQSLSSSVSSVQGKYSKIGAIEGTFNQKVREQEKTTLGQIHNAWAEINKDLVKISPLFEKLAVIGVHALVAIAAAITTVITGGIHLEAWFNKLSPPLQVMIELVGIFVAQGALFVGLLKAWELLKGVIWGTQVVMYALKDAFIATFMSNPWTLAIMAVVAVVVILITHWKLVKEVFMDVFDWVKNNWQLLAAILLAPIVLPAMIINKHWKALMGFFEGLPADFVKIFEAIGKAIISPFEWAIGKVEKVWKKFTKLPVISQVIGAIKWSGGVVGEIGSAIGIPGLAAGGTILGGGSVLVGERGPEILNLPRGASVKPLSPGGIGGENGQPLFVSKTELYLDRKLLAEEVGKYTAGKLARR
jgi:TP901 family phage tail tape measure protein